MKLFAFLFLIVSSIHQIYAQDPQIFDKSWRCEGITRSTGTYVSSPEIQFTQPVPSGSFFPNEVVISNCDVRSTMSIFSETENLFTLEGDIIVLEDVCPTNALENFQVLCFGVYWGAGDEPINPFTYTIIDDGDYKLLEVENANGGIAHYTNAPLVVNEFEIKKISIHPNPVASNLNITSKVLLKSLHIYDVQGREVHTTQFQPENPMITTETLKTGVYFLKAESDTGQQFIAKFVKK